MHIKKDNVISPAASHDKHDSFEAIGRCRKLKQEKKQVCEKAARTMLHALDAKDHYNFAGHSMRVAFYSISLGKEYGLNDDELYDLETAALFHDIGKIGVLDEVLLKPESSFRRRISQNERALRQNLGRFSKTLMSSKKSLNLQNITMKDSTAEVIRIS